MTLNSLIVISILTIGLNSFAAGTGYIAFGSGYAGVGKTNPELSNELKGGGTLWAEITGIDDFKGPQYTYRKTYAENDQVDLAITTHELGFTMMLPLPVFDFYLGVGGLWGGAQAEDKTTGFEDRKNVLGYFARAGFDLYFHKYFGVRGSFQNSTINLKDFTPTDDLRVTQNIVGVGLVIRAMD